MRACELVTVSFLTQSILGRQQPTELRIALSSESSQMDLLFSFKFYGSSEFQIYLNLNEETHFQAKYV